VLIPVKYLNCDRPDVTATPPRENALLNPDMVVRAVEMPKKGTAPGPFLKVYFADGDDMTIEGLAADLLNKIKLAMAPPPPPPPPAPTPPAGPIHTRA
jgi:hypothetical protein